jgi:soluble lytic murein transglycosylase
MKRNLHVVLLGAASLIASSALGLAWGQTQTKPPPKPASAAKPAAVQSHPTLAGRPAAAKIVARHPVFVPPPPIIDLDEITPPAGIPTVLDANNLGLYRRIFQEQAGGNWAAADAEIAKLSDKTLIGYVGAQRLLAPSYAARYDQLAAWLAEYNDHPNAPAIYRLAVVRRTKGGPDLTPASFNSVAQTSPSFAAARTVKGADAAPASELRARLEQMSNDGGFNAAFALLDRSTTVDTLGPQEVELWRGRIRTRALEADSQRGVQVPVDISAPPDANWSAGLGAFTGGNMAEAARRFELVADAAPDQASSWTLSAGAFWAARANLLAGNPQKFAPYLKRAALFNRTFYGLVAQKVLGMRIEPDWTLPEIDRSMATLLIADKAGRRALALLQLGSATAAEREFFSASLDADPQFIEAVLAVANKAVLPTLSIRVGNAAWDQRHKLKGYDGAMYPMPPWQPLNGFSLDRSLVYSFMRQESAFNPKARSYVGAMGLMQLMPSTARSVTARSAPETAGANPFDPSANISLGQAYLTTLLDSVDGNLVRAAAGYNGGPGNVARWDNSLNASQDPLLYVALIPLNETRDYVQRVLANYWMYSLRLGQPTPSLDQIAAHEWPRYVAQGQGR